MAAAIFLLALGLTGHPASTEASTVDGVGAGAADDWPVDPESDPFYDPPAGFEDEDPGSILRTRSVTVRGLGLSLPGLTTTQVLVRTTDSKGRPVATAATVMVPPRPTLFGFPLPYPGGRRPLVAYQPATDGLAARCEPSYKLQVEAEGELPFIGPLLLKGYVVVVPDHQGPRHAYGAGRVAGHATLDSVRAAESLPDTGLDGTGTPVGLWGYSGGAIATGWAAQLHPTYAPELDVVGAAPGGTPADFLAVARHMDGGPFSSIMFMVGVGIGREYPEYRELVNERGLEVEAALADDCIDEGALRFPFHRAADHSVLDDPLNDPFVIDLSREFSLGEAAPSAPVYLYHGLLDEGIPYRQARDLRDQWCARGSEVVFSTVAGEHLSTAVTEAPAVVRFLNDRFAGRAVVGACA